jgi:Zn-dependent metalloprotease
MIYGHPNSKSAFKDFALLDVSAHEITHGVIQHETGLDYTGQAGALNEHIADVFGELIEQYARHQTVDQADWVMTYTDNGGVHINDGIPNRAVAEFARAVGGYLICSLMG